MDELQLTAQQCKSRARDWTIFDLEDHLEALIQRVDTLQAALEKLLGMKIV